MLKQKIEEQTITATNSIQKKTRTKAENKQTERESQEQRVHTMTDLLLAVLVTTLVSTPDRKTSSHTTHTQHNNNTFPLLHIPSWNSFDMFMCICIYPWWQWSCSSALPSSLFCLTLTLEPGSLLPRSCRSKYAGFISDFIPIDYQPLQKSLLFVFSFYQGCRGKVSTTVVTVCYIHSFVILICPSVNLEKSNKSKLKPPLETTGRFRSFTLCFNSIGSMC